MFLPVKGGRNNGGLHGTDKMLAGILERMSWWSVSRMFEIEIKEDLQLVTSGLRG